MWNDPVNLMSYVTYVFQKLFGYSLEKATELMLDVHEKGRAVVASGTREEAEMHVFRLHEHSLWATMEHDGSTADEPAIVYRRSIHLARRSILGRKEFVPPVQAVDGGWRLNLDVEERCAAPPVDGRAADAAERPRRQRRCSIASSRRPTPTTRRRRPSTSG